MTRETAVVTASICAAILAASTIVARGGPLDPPQGPILPSYKTLDEVEPRIPITELPHTITETGSYYVTENLSGASGITVGAPGVTIDLMGHTLTRVGGQSPTAIEATDAAAGLVVRNGRLTGWDAGVAAEDTGDIAVHDVRFDAITFNAILVSGSALITNCEVQNCGDTGIITGDDSVIESVTVDTCAGSGVMTGDGSRLTKVTAAHNTAFGIMAGTASVIDRCVSRLNGDTGIVAGFRCLVIDCNANENGDEGVNLAAGSSLIRCTTTSNADDGVVGSSARIDQCVSSYNTGRGFSNFAGSMITDSQAIENGEEGIWAGGAVQRCYVKNNGATQIEAQNDSRVIDCHVQGGLTVGIEAGARSAVIGNTVDLTDVGIRAHGDWAVVQNNHMISNDIGVEVTGQEVLMVSNTVVNASDIAYAIGLDVRYGPIIDATSAGDLSTLAGADHPQANFIY